MITFASYKFYKNGIINLNKQNYESNSTMYNTFGSVISSLLPTILAVFLAIGLNKKGIAKDIVNLAFGITLGTVALTIVLSFRLGRHETAGQQMKKILDKFNKKL